MEASPSGREQTEADRQPRTGPNDGQQVLLQQQIHRIGWELWRQQPMQIYLMMPLTGGTVMEPGGSASRRAYREQESSC
eukprot:4975689-Amphidinium_carterae.1